MMRPKKILILGGGGREHALAVALKTSAPELELFAIPGNGGLADIATCVPELKLTELEAVRDYAREQGIDFAIPATDDVLVAGAVDLLEAAGIPCFGPSKVAAQIEGSKTFAKELMKNYHIPSAAYEVFSAPAAAYLYVKSLQNFPIVIKADGLALGKGVVIAEDLAAANKAIFEMMEEKKFGESGTQIVIEEFLTGPEVSVLAFADGNCVRPMVSSMDHKRALDGDLGPNTGGMGTIAPNPFYTKEIAARCQQEIFEPTIRALAAEGTPFRGCLYFGLMLTEQGPKVIEYNCRFGDPEAQVVLPLLDSDLLDILEACRSGTLSELEIRWKDLYAVCVIVSSNGYPGAYQTGLPITLEPLPEGTFLFHSGTKQRQNGALITNGGRVFGVTATGETLSDAQTKSYAAAAHVQFPGKFFRSDIGARALTRL